MMQHILGENTMKRSIMFSRIYFYGVLIVVLWVNLIVPFSSKAQSISRENAVVRAVRKVSPAVVNISSEYEIRKRINPFSGFGDPFFDSFFKDFFDPGFERRYQKTSLGSGVIIDGRRGLILTNAHVIAKAGKITVVVQDEREFEAQIVGADPESDLAVLRIQSSDILPSIEMGNSDDLMIGETVIAIGNPFGFSHTVTTGVISALHRSIRTEETEYHDFIQTDASINPGNSGGPLLNINGELIGINTAIYAKAQGIGFAIPINKARRIISDLIQYGEVIIPWIGVVVQNLDQKLANYLNLSKKSGVLIKEVEVKSPAQRSGIKDGDIITEVGNRPVRSVDDFNSLMKDYAPGDSIPFKILRNMRDISITVEASTFPMERADELIYKLMGIKVMPIPSKYRRSNLQEGVMIAEIERQSYLYRIGVKPGDIIRQMDGTPIRDISDFQKAIVKNRHKPSVVILLQREDQGYYITVKFS